MTPTALAVVLTLFLPAATSAQSRIAQEQPRLVAQLGHSNSLRSVAFSPDGRQVLTASSDHTARLWDTNTGRELRRFEGHTGQLSSAAFSPDGQQVLTVSVDGSARLWEVSSGRQLHHFEDNFSPFAPATFSADGGQVLTVSLGGSVRIWEADSGRELRSLELQDHGAPVISFAFSPDGQQVLTARLDQSPRLWEVSTGRELQRFEGDFGAVTPLTFSPDRRQVLMVSLDGRARLWEVSTGRELLSLQVYPFKEGTRGQLAVVAFSPDGRQLLTGRGGEGARLWEASTGRELQRIEGPVLGPGSVAFSPDGRQVLTHGMEHTARLWEASTGRELQRFESSSGEVRSVTFSHDGRQLLTGSDDGGAHLWEVSTGREIRRFEGRSSQIWGANHSAFSPDGQQVLTVSSGGSVRLWEVSTGRELQRFEGDSATVRSVAFSPDGRQLLTGSGEQRVRGPDGRPTHPRTLGSARLWEVSTGREIRRFEGDSVFVMSVAFSPDGRTVLTPGTPDGTARLWEASSGRELQRFEGHSEAVSSVAFSPDGERVLTGSRDGELRLWEASSGRELQRFEGHAHAHGVRAIAFSPDGQRVLTGSMDGTARLWEANSGRELRRFEGHGGVVSSVAFSPDGQQVVTGSSDSHTRIFDAATGALLASLISFRDGTWAVVDPQGRYDASNGGDVEGLHWVVGFEPIALSQLKERYYEPGLLAKVLGFNSEPLREVSAFRDVALYPEVEVTRSPTARDPRARVVLRNRGGGIGRVVVWLNGRELTPDARPAGANPQADSLVIPLDLSGSPFLLQGAENRLEVRAFNAEGYLASRPRGFGFESPAAASGAPPQLWAVVAGVSDYSGGALSLRYAAKDAADVAGALRLAGERLFGAERTHLTLLSTDPEAAGAHEPSRARLVSALQEVAARAASSDVVVVYLAGHGVVHGGVEGDYYYLTRDARSTNLEDPEVRRSVALSSLELTELLGAIPALKQVLILDTCGAGRAVQTLVAAREVPASQVRAIERMKDRTGMFVLAGSAADAVSYEASRYAQGVLTYSLLMGIKGAALREEEFVDVSTLFGFAVDRVPELARDIGGIQRPQLAAPRAGQSFDIGRLTRTDRERIPLAEAKPLVLRANFQDERRVVDHLGLTQVVNEALRQASARARGGGSLVFVDAESFPGAYSVGGRYSVAAGEVRVSGFLFRGEEEVGAFTVAGQAEDLAGLAERIRGEAERLIVRASRR